MNELKELARQIFSEFKKAKKILIVLHLHPDGDVIGAGLSLNYFLSKKGKKVRIVCADEIHSNFTFVKDYQKIEIKDFADLNLKKFDLILFLDSSPNNFTKKEFKLPGKICSVWIDHHQGETKFAKINAVFPEISSVCQVLYELFGLQKIKIDKNLANWLYLGVYSDTGGFQFGAPAKTHEVAADLLRKGANHNKIVFNLTRKKSLSLLKSWGKLLENLKIDLEYHFCWSTISYKELQDLNCQPSDYYGGAEFLKQVEGTNFGFVLVEEEPGGIRGNLRSRRQPEDGGFDVSQIAVALGGGGHKAAAGFSLKMSLPEAEAKTLAVARKFAKNKR